MELDGPSSIAHAFNNVTLGDQGTKPIPRRACEKQPTSTTTGVSHAVHARQGSTSTSDVVATGSKARVKDTEDTEDEDDEDATVEMEIESTEPACNHASMVSRKVRWWADELKKIRQVQVESLFEEKTVRDTPFLIFAYADCCTV